MKKNKKITILSQKKYSEYFCSKEISGVRYSIHFTNSLLDAVKINDSDKSTLMLIEDTFIDTVNDFPLINNVADDFFIFFSANHDFSTIIEFALFDKRKGFLKSQLTTQHSCAESSDSDISELSSYIKYLEQVINYSKRYKNISSILLLSIDSGKNIINSTTPDHSDDLFRKILTQLKSILRSTDMVFYIGEEKFLIILSKIEKNSDSAKIASFISKTMASITLSNNSELSLEYNIGIANFPEDGETSTTLLKNAKYALALSQKNKNMTYQFYSEKLNDTAAHKFFLLNELRKALKSETFHIHYQPQIDTKSNKLIAVEALARWQHPTLGNIPPSEFISLAEDHRLIHLLGKLIFKKACEQMKFWYDNNLIGFKVGINVSNQEMTDYPIFNTISTIISDIGISPALIDLEITESVFAKDIEQTKSVLDQFREAGFQIAMDDFGTGYSCLSYLTKLPIDRIKIDQSFIRNMSSSSHDMGIVKAIIAIAQHLDIAILAEGIESEKEKQQLEALDCYTMQGYYFAKPLPAEEMTALLQHYQNPDCDFQNISESRPPL